MFSRDLIKALEEDGAKLRALTGKDHGPLFPYSDHGLTEEDMDNEYPDWCYDEDDFDGYNYDEDYPNEDDIEEWENNQ